ncbi:ABC transporter permease [Adlercreutzia murintestinalis]|uniref:ABC transporter permease n=1 Tax=Adlercreutzia murintestinalis TaxID=2941325 RepID=UPI00203A41D8|nr:ABC transporter permease subunit [Adlercreutzia murintestinalis]
MMNAPLEKRNRQTLLEKRKRQMRRATAIARTLVGVELALVALPLLVIVVWAFTDAWPWPDLWPQAFSARGIEQALSGRQNMGWDTLALSIGIAAACAVLTTAVAALACRALCHFQWRGRDVFQFATILPFIIPSTVFAMGIQVVFLQIGLARTVPGVILAHSIVALPYAIILMTDITRAAGTHREEAARSLGAGPWQMLRHVTIPQLLPGIVSSLSMCYIMSFSQYFLTLLVGGGRVQTFVLVLFPYLSGGDRTIACAYSLVFLVVTFAVFLIFELLLRRFGAREEGSLYG